MTAEKRAAAGGVPRLDDYIIIPIGVILLLGFVFWLNTRLRQSKWVRRAEMQKQFIDRFSSAAELNEFLSTEHGRSVFEDSLTERKDQRLKVLGVLRTGIVLVCLGVGFVLLLDDDPSTIFPATICLSLGIGFLLAALISYRAAKSLRVVEEKRPASEA